MALRRAPTDPKEFPRNSVRSTAHFPKQPNENQTPLHVERLLSMSLQIHRRPCAHAILARVRIDPPPSEPESLLRVMAKNHSHRCQLQHRWLVPAQLVQAQHWIPILLRFVLRWRRGASAGSPLTGEPEAPTSSVGRDALAPAERVQIAQGESYSPFQTDLDNLTQRNRV